MMPKRAKSKWHAVAVGRQIGAWYAPWEQIEPLVKGFRRKCHASFKTEQAALKFVERYKLAPEVKPARNTVSKERFLNANPELKQAEEKQQQKTKVNPFVGGEEYARPLYKQLFNNQQSSQVNVQSFFRTHWFFILQQQGLESTEPVKRAFGLLH